MRSLRLAVLVAPLALACAGGGGLDLSSLGSALDAAGGGGALDESTVASGLKDALRVGTERTVETTSRVDGYLGNDLIRIPLPEELDPMARGLRTVGMGAKVDELEVAMNRAAEQAAGEALEVFWAGIREMSVRDAWDILNGPEDAATRYFRRTTGEALRARFEPIVDEKMTAVGLVQLYDDATARYRALPFSQVAGQPPELRGYVTDRALDGLFTVLAREEARIREDPAARTTALLQRVFGEAAAREGAALPSAAGPRAGAETGPRTGAQTGGAGA